MTHKKVDNADAGTLDIFGGNDLDKWSDFASGVDVDDYDINSDIAFRLDKLQIRNAANTFGHKLRSLATAARTLTLPDFDAVVGDQPWTPTWTIYQSGSNYKARSGALGYTPTGAVSTSLDTVWAYVDANFSSGFGGTPSTGRGGIIQFAPGEYVFTTEVALDHTINTGAEQNTGFVVQGAARGTRIRFEPSSATRSGFYISRVHNTILRDLYIELGPNVGKGIYFDVEQTNNLNHSLVDNIFIQTVANTEASRTAGQVGIYVKSEDYTTHFNHFRKIFTKWMDTGIEFGIDNSVPGNRNTSFIGLQDIDMWGCTKGLNIGDFVQEIQVNGFVTQDMTQGTGDYGIRIGTEVSTCQINNVNADGLGKAGAAAVLLDKGAEWNKLVNINNTGAGAGADAVLDLSGNGTNIVIASQAVAARNKTGIWEGSTTAVGGCSGLMQAAFTESGTNMASTPGDHIDDTEGKGFVFTTAAAANAKAGLYMTGRITRRQTNPLYNCRFTLSSTTGMRLWIGLTNDVAIPPSSNSYITAKSVIGLAIRSTDTNFQIMQNDMLNNTAFSDMLDKTNTAIPVTQYRTGTSAHELYIFADTRNNRWYICLDRNYPQSFTTNMPANTDNLGVVCSIESVDGAAKTFNLYQQRLETKR